MATTFKSLEDFAQHFPQVALELVADVAKEVHRELHSSALEEAQRVSGLASSSGELATSWHSEPAAPDSAIDSLAPTKIVNTAPHANIINRGRKPSENAFQVRRGGKTFTVPAGKMLGSTKLPQGIKRPVVRALKSQEEAIVSRAIARAETKHA